MKKKQQDAPDIPAKCPKCSYAGIRREVHMHVWYLETYYAGKFDHESTVRKEYVPEYKPWKCVACDHEWYYPPRKARLRIEQDTDAMSPREDANLGTMVCFHERYDLGDKHDYKYNQIDDWSHLEKRLKKEHDALHILPLYLLDHSGLALSCKPFGCPFDSRQVGFVFTTAKRMAEIGVAEDDVEEALRSEIITYDQYLQQDVWGYILEDLDGNTIDSCFGFYARKAAEDAGLVAAEAEGVELVKE